MDDTEVSPSRPQSKTAVHSDETRCSNVDSGETISQNADSGEPVQSGTDQACLEPPSTDPVSPASPSTDPVGPAPSSADSAGPAPPSTDPVVPASPSTDPVVPAPSSADSAGPAPPSTDPVVPASPSTDPVVPAPPITDPTGPAPSSTIPAIPVQPSADDANVKGNADANENRELGGRLPLLASVLSAFAISFIGGTLISTKYGPPALVSVISTVNAACMACYLERQRKREESEGAAGETGGVARMAEGAPGEGAPAEGVEEMKSGDGDDTEDRVSEPGGASLTPDAVRATATAAALNTTTSINYAFAWMEYSFLENAGAHRHQSRERLCQVLEYHHRLRLAERDHNEEMYRNSLQRFEHELHRSYQDRIAETAANAKEWYRGWQRAEQQMAAARSQHEDDMRRLGELEDLEYELKKVMVDREAQREACMLLTDEKQAALASFAREAAERKELEKLKSDLEAKRERDGQEAAKRLGYQLEEMDALRRSSTARIDDLKEKLRMVEDEMKDSKIMVERRILKMQELEEEYHHEKYTGVVLRRQIVNLKNSLERKQEEENLRLAEAAAAATAEVAAAEAAAGVEAVADILQLGGATEEVAVGILAATGAASAGGAAAQAGQPVGRPSDVCQEMAKIRPPPPLSHMQDIGEAKQFAGHQARGSPEQQAIVEAPRPQPREQGAGHVEQHAGCLAREPCEQASFEALQSQPRRQGVGQVEQRTGRPARGSPEQARFATPRLQPREQGARQAEQRARRLARGPPAQQVNVEPSHVPSPEDAPEQAGQPTVGPAHESGERGVNMGGATHGPGKQSNGYASENLADMLADSDTLNPIEVDRSSFQAVAFLPDDIPHRPEEFDIWIKSLDKLTGSSDDEKED